MERLNHQEPLSHVPMQATLTPATTSQRRLRRSVFQAIALPLLSLGVLSSCSDQAIKPASGDPTDSAVSALTTCSGNMLTDTTGTSVTDATLPMGYSTKRTKDSVGVNYWSGEGYGLQKIPSTPTAKTVTSTFNGNMPVRRFPGGLGGTWDWSTDSHKAELNKFVLEAKAEEATRLFFVVNTNGVFHLNQDGGVDNDVVPRNYGVANTRNSCVTLYNYASCKTEMAKHAKLFADQVVSEISAAWGTDTWPEIVFEIGNEVPLLERHPNANCDGTTCTNGTYENYADVFDAYCAKMRTSANGMMFKFAVAGLFPEHASDSIWAYVKSKGTPYDYRVIHDYGFAPEVNGKMYGSNVWGADPQTMVPNGSTTMLGPTVYGLANFDQPKPVVVTEFGTPDGHCTGSPCTATDSTNITYTEAVLNDALLATTRMNISDPNILSVNLKWPAKSRSTGQNARSWQENDDGMTAKTGLLPVYYLYLMMGNFLNAQPVSVPGQVGSYSGLLRATAANATRRFAVYTNLTPTNYKISADITGTMNSYTPSLAGIKGEAVLTSTAMTTPILQCSKALNSGTTTLTFGIAANSVVVVTY